MTNVQQAKNRLDSIIAKARVDLYKPIQIAEVLRKSRLENIIDIADLKTYQNQSIHWRNQVTKRLLNKISTSSSRYQHDIWNSTAMPPELLNILDEENKRTKGGVESYIYIKFSERQSTVASLIAYIEESDSKSFNLKLLLDMFLAKAGIRRSIDKAYEIVAYSLFETIVVSLDAEITVSIPQDKQELLNEFSDLAKALLGIDEHQNAVMFKAHVYRVGVTNAADRGLDMWANFGLAIQIKHLTLDTEIAQDIVDKVESDHIVIVCRDAHADVIRVITQQISWGQRVRGIIRESELIDWYERCLRGRFSSLLAIPLLNCLSDSFKKEFPHSIALAKFLEEREYLKIDIAKNDTWCAKELSIVDN
jgi:type II restriction enzyme